MRFQPMAPMRPANTTPTVRTPALGSTTSLAMVVATLVPNTRKAAKLKNAAHITAYWGRSTRVATTVAIELAESWKPLVKSNASASTMTKTTPADIARLRVLQNDRLHHVGDILNGVQRRLHGLNDV